MSRPFHLDDSEAFEDPPTQTGNKGAAKKQGREKRRRLSADSNSSTSSTSASDVEEEVEFVEPETPSARSKPIAMPDYLAQLIDKKTVHHTNPTQWFTIEKLREKLEECKQKVTGPDRYISDDGKTPVFIEKKCGCWLPSSKDRTNRPEIKITQPFLLSGQQYDLVKANQGTGAGKFPKDTFRLRDSHSMLVSKNVRYVYVALAVKLSRSLETVVTVSGKKIQYDVSHLCHNGDEGCFNPDHLVLEPKSVNLERRQCWQVIKCAVPDCNGYLIGNRCKGHGKDDAGEDRLRCLVGALAHPCLHYTAHASVV